MEAHQGHENWFAGAILGQTDDSRCTDALPADLSDRRTDVPILVKRENC